MFRQNLHVHSTWDDGKNTAEEMICAAMEAGLTSVGISVHAPMPFGVGILPQNLPAFREDMRRLKAQYAGRIRVYTGIEWDVYSETALYEYDYVIGSAHHVKIPCEVPAGIPQEYAERFSVDYPSVDDTKEKLKNLLHGRHFAGDADALAKAYFAQLEEMADNPEVDIVGHFDLIRKFDEGDSFFDEESGSYKQAAERAMKKLVDAGKIFEINTGAIARGHRSAPYPSVRLLRALREMGGKITISSDAHRAQDVVCAYAQAQRLAKDCGFAEAYVLTDGGFEPVKL